MNILTILLITGIMVVLVVAVMFFFGYFRRELLKLPERIIQKQNESEVQTRSIISTRLHNEVGSPLRFAEESITQIKATAEILGKRYADVADMKKSIQESLEWVLQAKDTLRDIYDSTYPSELNLGLLLLPCRKLVQSRQINFDGTIQFEYEGDIDALKDSENSGVRYKTLKFNLYQIINLFLTNSVLHSNAKMIWVNLRFYNNTIMIQMKDNGQGFDIEELKKTSNRRGIFDIEALAFSLDRRGTYISKIGEGTRLELEIKL
jgi:signal transduction histidine kinase